MSDKTYLSQITDTIYDYTPSVSFTGAFGAMLGCFKDISGLLFPVSAFVGPETFNNMISGYKAASVLVQLPGVIRVISSSNLDLARKNPLYADKILTDSTINYLGFITKFGKVIETGITTLLPVKIASYINDYMNPVVELEVTDVSQEIQGSYEL